MQQTGMHVHQSKQEVLRRAVDLESTLSTCSTVVGYHCARESSVTITAGGGPWSSCEGGETIHHGTSEWYATREAGVLLKDYNDCSSRRDTTLLEHGYDLDHHDPVRTLLTAAPKVALRWRTGAEHPKARQQQQ